MRAHLSAGRPLTADPWPAVERFREPPGAWAPAPARVLPDGRVLATVRVGPLSHLVALDVGRPWMLPDAVSRPLRWSPCKDDGTPVHDRVLPGFDGRITLRHGEREIRLILEGSYVPPAGPLGAAADRVAMHHAGETTARTLLDDVATRLLAAVGQQA